MKTVIIENKEQVEEIISRCDICFVGITDLEGNPYVIPMNFRLSGRGDLSAFRSHGQQHRYAGKKQPCLHYLQCRPRIGISASQSGSSYRMRAKSVICRGRVNFIEDPEEKREALNILMRHTVAGNLCIPIRQSRT